MIQAMPADPPSTAWSLLGAVIDTHDVLRDAQGMRDSYAADSQERQRAEYLIRLARVTVAVAWAGLHDAAEERAREGALAAVKTLLSCISEMRLSLPVPESYPDEPLPSVRGPLGETWTRLVQVAARCQGAPRRVRGLTVFATAVDAVGFGPGPHADLFIDAALAFVIPAAYYNDPSIDDGQVDALADDALVRSVLRALGHDPARFTAAERQARRRERKKRREQRNPR